MKLKGDINADNNIDILDYAIATGANLGIITLTAEEVEVADITGDGVIDNLDVSRIGNHIKGKKAITEVI